MASHGVFPGFSPFAPHSTLPPPPPPSHSPPPPPSSPTVIIWLHMKMEICKEITLHLIYSLWSVMHPCMCIKSSYREHKTPPCRALGSWRCAHHELTTVSENMSEHLGKIGKAQKPGWFQQAEFWASLQYSPHDWCSYLYIEPPVAQWLEHPN